MNNVNGKLSAPNSHSTANIVLFSSTTLIISLIPLFFASRIVIFYETEILFDPLLLGTVMILFTIWDAVNDPLMGSISDKKYHFTSRWGKRYPWIMLGFLVLILVFPFIFLPVTQSKWSTFFYLIFILLIFEAGYTLLGSSYMALRNVKFSQKQERRKNVATGVIYRMVGIVIALVAVPFIIENGNPMSYFISAVILSGVVLIVFLLQIKYSREEQSLLEQYEKEPENSLKDNIRIALKTGMVNRKYIGSIIMLLGTLLWDAFFIASIPYFIKYVVKADPDTEILLYIPYILTALVVAPLTIKLCSKFPKMKLYLISIFIIGIPTFLMGFMEEINIFVILISIFAGAGTTVLNISHSLILMEVLDELAKKSHIRQEGFYNGVVSFVTRIVTLVQVPIFLLIHNLTGFKADRIEQSASAIWGINIHLAIIPAVLVVGLGLVGVSVFNSKSNSLSGVPQAVAEPD